MIEIKTNFTLEEIAESNFETKKKFKIISIVCILVGAIGIVPAFILVMNNDNFVFSFLLGLFSFLLIFFSLLLFTMRPSGFKKRLLKVNPALKDGIEYTYIFEENEFIVKEKLTTAESNNKIKYVALKKVVISDKFLYLYLNQIQAFPIKKADINDIDIEEIKKLLANKIR